jgi:hypothetical protein
MSLLDDLDKAPENARKEKRKHPTGWEPGVEWDGQKGQITAQWDHKVPDWGALLALWDFDPAQYEIIEPVQVRTWDAAVGNGEVRRMWYHRANIRRKRAGGPDLDALIADIRRRRPSRLSEPDVAEGAYFLALNDWQLGHAGTAEMVDRITAGIDDSVKRIRDLRRIGRRINAIYLTGLGDLPEATSGHYPMQQFEVELDGREQAKLARRLLLYAIDRHRDLAPRIVCPAVAGNHGEKRQDGKAYTSFGDNMDLEIFEGVGEALATNPAAYGHVSVVVPRNELTLTVQPIEGGPIVGLAHGHQARVGGSSAQLKLRSYWSGQSFGGQPVGDADILLVGHFHQFMVHIDGKRTLMIAPTVSRSQWFRETHGTDSEPGMLSFLLTRDGWDDLKLL